MASNEVITAVIGAAPTLVVGVGTTIAALYAARLASSYRRQLDLKTSEARMEAYAALWALFRVAAPTRPQPMSEAERLDLFEQTTDWYYAKGNGMLLTAQTRQIYLKAKLNLRCPDDQLFPPSLRTELPPDPVDRERWRGQLSQDQLSLLRTQMKADLAITGKVYSGLLSRRDIAFLEACGVTLAEEPWTQSRQADQQT